MTQIALIFLYLISRLTNLMSLAQFSDELMYAYWAKLIATSPLTNAFISFTDGQQPLYFWFLAPLVKFISDPILALRLFSVITGLLTLVFLNQVASLIANQKTFSFIPGLLYLTSPFFLFYDRLGIKDSFLSLIAILVAFTSLKLAKTQHIRWAIGLFFALLIGLLTKSISYFFIPLSFAGLLFAPKSKLKLALLFTGLAAISAISTQSLQWFIPMPFSIQTKNSSFLIPASTLSQFPLWLWKRNLASAISWLMTYLTWPILLICSIGLYLIKDNRQKVFLLFWILFPIISEILIADIFFPRYFLFAILFVFIFISLTLQSLSNKCPRLFLPLLIGILIFPTIKSIRLITDITSASLAPVDRWQYLTGWPSGYGFDKLVQYLKSRSDESLTIYMENTTLFTSGLPLYLTDTNLKFAPIFSVNQDNLNLALTEIPKQPNNYLLLFNHRQQFPPEFNYELIAQFNKIDNQESIKVFAPQ